MGISVGNQVEPITVQQQRKNQNPSMMENRPTVLNRMDILLMRNSAISIMPASECSTQCKFPKKIAKSFICLSFVKNNKFKTLIVCSDGVITEKLCPDGMVFNDYSIDQEKCDLPFNIDCTKRSKLREYIYFHMNKTHGTVGYLCSIKQMEIQLGRMIK